MKLVSPVYTLNVDEWNTKKNYLVSLGKAVTKSIHTDKEPEAALVNPERYKEGVNEVFHLDLGPKAVHCLIMRTEGVRKKKPVYEFCYHHRGYCPHTKLVLKRKVL